MLQLRSRTRTFSNIGRREKLTGLMVAVALASVGIAQAHAAPAAPPAGPTPVSVQVSCVTSSLTTDIAYPINPLTGFINGPQVTTPGMGGTSANLGGFNSLSLIDPSQQLECAAVLQDAQTGAPILDPNLVDGGTVEYTLSSPNNSAYIMESQGAVKDIGCGAASKPGGWQSCQGAFAASAPGFVTANPGFVVHIGFRPGVTAFGMRNGVSALSGISFNATFQRFTSLN